MSMADQFDSFDDDELLEELIVDDDDMACYEHEFAGVGLDPIWTDGCPDDICNSQGWCRHRYKRDPR